MVEQNSNPQGQEPVPYVTADMAWEMSKRAAAEAREEALKEVQRLRESAPVTQSAPVAQSAPITQNAPKDNGMRYDDRDYDNREYNNRRDDDDDRGRRKRRRRDEDDDDDENMVGFSPKLIKQLQTTVGVFNTLKDFASNPMQKAIEDRIGGLAAGIIENAFTRPSGPPPKKDMFDTILNSQMAFGLGQGLGSRAPELVESLSKSFGREKAENMIEGMIGKYSGGGGQRSAGPAESDKAEARASENSRTPREQPKSEDQSNIELLLSLDPNNPEHVAAYAESQGGISIDVARKMLMIHQDDIIKRMKSQGADTAILESQRGSRIVQDKDTSSQHNITDQGNISKPPSPQNASTHRVDVAHDYQNPPIQQANDAVPQGQHAPPVHNNPPQHVPPVYNNPTQQVPPVQKTPFMQEFPSDQPISRVPHADNVQSDNRYTEQDIESLQRDSQQPGQEYAEYKDMGKQDGTNENFQEKSNSTGSTNNQQAEMMKVFAEDIGKVMGEMIGKIETLNNTVFTLQNEINEVKKQKVQPSPIQPAGYTYPQEDRYVQDLSHEDIQRPGPVQNLPSELGDIEDFEREQYAKPSQDLPQENVRQYTSTRDFFPEPGDEDYPKEEKEAAHSQNREDAPQEKMKNMEDFFPEKVQSAQDFERELREESERAAKLTRKESVDETKVKEDIVSKVEIEQKKEVEVVRRPTMSMVNKKKVAYLPKQKGDNTQLDNIKDNNSENNENGESQQTIDSSSKSSEVNKNIGNGENGEVNENIESNSKSSEVNSDVENGESKAE